jgi:CheY-like chemotaxis protein
MNKDLPSMKSFGTILIVEDDPVSQKLMQELCRKLEYNVVVVGNGEDALRLIQASSAYVAILVDIGLPGMDGVECIKRIREVDSENARHTPIVAVTGLEETSDKDVCLNAGADDYLSKPFAPDQLRKRLLRWLYQPARPNLNLLEGTASTDLNHS